MADSERDKAMRVVGALQAATQALEMVTVPHEQRRVRELVELAKHTANKAMLAMWEEADRLSVKASGEPIPSQEWPDRQRPRCPKCQSADTSALCFDILECAACGHEFPRPAQEEGSPQ